MNPNNFIKKKKKRGKKILVEKQTDGRMCQIIDR